MSPHTGTPATTPSNADLPARRSLASTLGSTWTLLFGIGLLMVANGLQGSLLGVRAELEAFGPVAIGLIMAGFFAGMFTGSLWTPQAVRVVGHVRVFAAMSAIASVSILLHSVLVDEIVWWAMRFVTGFCYAGIFVVAESWLNDRASSETRGQVLALYMAVTFAGLGGGQFLLNLASSEAALLFMVVSILISLAVVPLLLHASSVPRIEGTRRVSMRRLARASPLGVFATFVAGIANGTVFGMGAVYARSAGFSVADTSLFMASLIFGAAILQWPIGKLSDWADRRRVLTAVAALAGLACLLASRVDALDSVVSVLLVAASGGLTLSIHSLGLTYTNDHLEPDEMIGASSNLVLLLGAGSVCGPLVVGAILSFAGPTGYFQWLAASQFVLVGFAIYRMTRREAMPMEAQTAYVPAPLQGMESATAVAERVAQRSEAD